MDHSKFKLYKPPPNVPIHCNLALLEGGGQLTEAHISECLYLPLKVDEVFPEKDDTWRLYIDLIIQVSLEEHCEHGRFLPLL